MDTRSDQFSVTKKFPSESRLHRFLKEVGMAFLFNYCFMVATEVSVYKGAAIDRHDLDNHYFIDVAGIGKKYLPYTRDRKIGGPYYFNVSRGIEVKVSRSDFRSGFVCSGCNYHYLITPMRLINPAELPKWVGLIEYNKHKFNARFRRDYKFEFQGLRVVKNPQFQETRDFQIEYVTSSIGGRLSSIIKMNLVKTLCKKQGDEIE